MDGILKKFFGNVSALKRLVLLANLSLLAGSILFGLAGTFAINSSVQMLETALSEDLFRSIANSARHAALTGDFEDLRRIFKSAATGPLVDWIRWRSAATGTEVFCIQGAPNVRPYLFVTDPRHGIRMVLFLLCK